MKMEVPSKKSPCDTCAFARGLKDGLVMSPGDKQEDCVWCTNTKLIEEYHYEACDDEKYGFGTMLYKVGVLSDHDSCEFMLLDEWDQLWEDIDWDRVTTIPFITERIHKIRAKGDSMKKKLQSMGDD